MKEPAYCQLIALLTQAKRILAANTGDLNPADFRIRALVHITGRETQRALLMAAAEACLADAARKQKPLRRRPIVPPRPPAAAAEPA